MQLTVKGTMVPLLRDLDRIAKAVPQVAVTALNKTAFEVRDALKAEMNRVFDRPKPYTLGGVFVVKADERTKTAIVNLKDERATSKGIPANTFLQAQIRGGGRSQRRFERWLVYAGIIEKGQYAIPARHLPLDQYGNPPQGLYTQILSALSASPDAYQNQTDKTRERRLKRERAGRAYRIFVIRRNGKAIGIARGNGRYGAELFEMLFFFGRQPMYKARFDFYKVAAKTAREQLPKKIDQAWAALGDNVYKTIAKRGA